MCRALDVEERAENQWQIAAEVEFELCPEPLSVTVNRERGRKSVKAGRVGEKAR